MSSIEMSFTACKTKTHRYIEIQKKMLQCEAFYKRLKTFFKSKRTEEMMCVRF